MIQHNTPLVLGSASPRRSEILRGLSIPIRIVTPQTDEERRKGERPDAYLNRVVIEKLRNVASQLDCTSYGGVLVADTIVVLDESIMGKPSDVTDACHMLRRLSGRAHVVFTRFAISLPSSPSHPVHEETVRTLVRFRDLGDDEILRYASTREGLDKAGAYAAQGIGSFAIEGIFGSYSNVIGLPACEVVVALQRTGLIGAYPL